MSLRAALALWACVCPAVRGQTLSQSGVQGGLTAPVPVVAPLSAPGTPTPGAPSSFPLSGSGLLPLLPVPALDPAVAPAAAAPQAAAPVPAASLRAASPMRAVRGAAEAGARPAPAEKSSGLWTRLARMFDGVREQSPAGEFADYLQSSPAVPLPERPRTPVWERLSRSQDPQGAVSFHTEKSETLGEGQSIPISRDYSAPGPFETRRIRSEAPLAVAPSGDWTLPAGDHDAAAFGDDLYWIDHGGRLVVYSLEKKTAAAYSASGGPVTRFLVAKQNQVYVVAGGSLRRWDLADTYYARTYPKLPQDADSITRMVQGEDSGSSDALTFHLPGKRLKSSFAGIIVEEGTLAGSLPAGRSLFLRQEAGGTRVLRASGATGDAEDLGRIPFRVLAVIPGPAMETLYAAVPEGLVVWDVRGGRYRLIAVPGLDDAGVRPSLHLHDGTVYLGAGSRILSFQSQDLQDAVAPDDSVRLWSERSPMFVRDSALHIGDFAFPIARKAPAPRSWARRLQTAFRRVLGRPSAPPEVADLGISESDWKALNLPTNKKVVYDTLKAFTLRQHVLYIGETGGGKTWIAERIARLTGNDLWMVSMNEYTRNKDLIARETFGEEGKNRTGLTASTVLRWMQEGGVLLLDEMHKPLEGIAILNNILQNGEYRLPDGRVIKLDRSRSWVIGTMNPVKPPYKGEPPSGELSSRFGTTLDVKYLPPDEEAALLKIFYGKVDPKLVEKLVTIANELRKAYPEVLPLPIAPRTLLHIVEHVQRFPKDSVADIFSKTYNPASIVEDPAITALIQQVLARHGLVETEEETLRRLLGG